MSLTACTLLLTGCGVFGGDDGGSSEASKEPVNGGKVDPGDAEARETLASQDISMIGTDLHYAVHELSRGAKTVELTFSVTNIGDEESGIVFSFLGRGGKEDVSGVKLIDPDNGKVHLPATDSNGDCVCSSYSGSMSFEPDDSVLYSATYGAPPEDVKTMDVSIPNVGTLTDVPLS
ncbi:hypothetical protein CDO52_20720 [Nocardiopsis gilva YIM 90087]|uniref:DUF4352 domain-containing protein n=2 Tax=Nocardiopsis gilva TaxID=280236 RepID=A0A223S9W9_9ACTN|nr:hypothetical protein [Nocardiopsis gilva]ASU84892.1 hypothetical protein CDO52_20720 [Nocardiopsis gilva YIM 90087]